MLAMTYQNMDRHLVEMLPLLAVPHAYCLAQEDVGEHPGQYIIFEGILRTYLDILLALPSSPARDRQLRHAFAFVEMMFQRPDPEVRNLAKIAVFEGQSTWWFARGAPFIGPMARSFLDVFEVRWRGADEADAAPDPDYGVIDIHGVREAVLHALKGEVAGLPPIPGVGAPYKWRQIANLHVARQVPDGVIFLSCFGTSDPLLVAPVAAVTCNPVALLQLARDLAAYDLEEPDAREQALSACYFIPVGERVWRMQIGEWEHGRYAGTLWVAPQLVAHGLVEQIESVLVGQRHRLPASSELPF